MTAQKPSRNAPCPCGSGKKYKRCCFGTTAERSRSLSSWVAIVVGVLSVLRTIAIVAADFTSSEPAEEPPRVWSPDHGHWHNVQ